MVYRIYVEKKKDLAKEAADLLHEARELLQIRSLTGVRIINRYDVENIEKDLFPVCPNCHAMLHRRKESILSIEELKQIIQQNRDKEKNLSL